VRPLYRLGGDGCALGVAQLRPQARASLLDPLHHRSQPHQDHEYQHTLKIKNMKYAFRMQQRGALIELERAW